MKILAFDTSSTACSVAIRNGEDIRVSNQIAPMQQAKLLLPTIHELLAASGLTLNELDAIAFGQGPGSFTGMRIAASVAQGIGFAANIPIIPLSSLAIIAQAAFMAQGGTTLLVALDARMDQIYWAIYKVNEQGYVDLVGDEQLLSPDMVILPEHCEGGVGIGDGWDKYTEKLVTQLKFRPEIVYASQLPSAHALLKLAEVGLKRGNQVALSDAIPVYLR